MDGEAGWWTTCGNIGLPPLARVMGVGRQQQGVIMKLSEIRKEVEESNYETRRKKRMIVFNLKEKK